MQYRESFVVSNLFILSFPLSLPQKEFGTAKKNLHIPHGRKRKFSFVI